MEAEQPRSWDARLKEGSRNVGIDGASAIILSFSPVDFWISPRDHTPTQTCDKRVVSKDFLGLATYPDFSYRVAER